MIKSMTAFGTGQAQTPQLTVNIELRSVNSRYLDINIRMPDELRYIESSLRELINSNVNRGKVELRLNYTKTFLEQNQTINAEYLESVANNLNIARQFLPETPSPSLYELLNKSNEIQGDNITPEIWTELSQTACKNALEQLVQARLNEGQRLAQFMLEQSQEIINIVSTTSEIIPNLNLAHQEKITNRIKDLLNAVCPIGFENISGSELSARIAQEASLFALRGDVEEELTRIKSHIQELQNILNPTSSNTRSKGKSASTGKRIDFLCQELNREANTLGSKASGMEITNAAIDLKLLIEQLREQAQNIE